MTSEFVEFLLEAKRRTYAAQGDDASVESALPGSKQLEHRRGEYVYRDIYFGIRRFVGQETVYHAGRPVWSMAYGGGIGRSDADTEEVRSVYAFLREAMRQVSSEQPYRGPLIHHRSQYTYACSSTGDMEMFWGVEEISDRSGVVYRLHFAGGRVDE
jgi:hypothetical protein